MSTYSIVRFFFGGASVVRQRGLTLEQAQAHCKNPETSSRTCTDNPHAGQWFDGYKEERRHPKPLSMLDKLAILQKET